MDTGQDYSATHEHETRGGKRVVEEILATPILDEGGEIIQSIEGIRDVTRGVSLQEEMRRNKEYRNSSITRGRRVFLTRLPGGRRLFFARFARTPHPSGGSPVCPRFARTPHPSGGSPVCPRFA
ncbi:MAG: hypothetical protein J7M32_07025, partial [Deltaproteobacteria bacterium]|nr:hypothetical protein [Deltaproteobacteria bacterium]